MRHDRLFPRAPLAIFVFLLHVFAAAAQAGTYVEDFTTTTYKDPSTTALWDTVAGEIKLWPFQMSIMAECQTSGTARSLAIDGSLAFIADYNPSGLEIIDISDSTSPTSVGRFTAINPRDVTIHGNYAYIMESGTGIEIVDISDPAAPTLAGSYNTPGYAYRGKVRGNLLYVADDTGGLLILDITNPTTPVFAGAYYPPSGKIRDIVFRGTHAYLAGDLSGLYVVDITNPTSPVYVGSVDTPGAAQRLAIQGDHVFIADLNGGIRVVDIGNPAIPAIIGSHACPGNVNGVFVTGTYVYAAATAGLVLFDMADPAAPVALDTLATPGDAMEVIVAGGRAYVADGSGGGLQVVRAASEVSPFAGWAHVDVYSTTSFLELDGDVMAVPKNNDMLIVDVSNPTQPAVAATRAAPNVVSMDMEGGLLYMSVGVTRCLRVWDVSDPWNPTPLDSFPLEPGAVETEGSYAYVATANALFAVDVSDPSDCDTAGSFPDQAEASHFPAPKDIVIAGNIAFVSATDRIFVFDISNPASPDSAGVFLQTGADEMVVSGDCLYLIRGPYFRILNIRDPRHPVLLSEQNIDSFFGFRGIVVDGHWAYVTYASEYRRGYLNVYDVSDPSSPRLLHTENGTHGVAVLGDYLCVIDQFYLPNLEIYQRFERHLAANRNIGQSVNILSGADLVSAVRLSATYEGNIEFHASVDGGSSWTAVAPGSWYYLSLQGSSDLRWRTVEHMKFSPPGISPACTQLQLDWEYRPRTAWIESVTDVPNDQGGAVRVTWEGPFNDSLAYSSLSGPKLFPAGGYSVYRKVDPALPKGECDPGKTEGNQKLLLPPGSWDFVAQVPAARDRSGPGYTPYSVIVPTLADSTEGGYGPFVFCIRTTGVEIRYVDDFDDSTMEFRYHTGDSGPDSGWSVDNLSPAVPPYGVEKRQSPRGRSSSGEESAGLSAAASQLEAKGISACAVGKLAETRDAPVILSITDVPGDEGRQVRIDWFGSYLEMYGVSFDSDYLSGCLAEYGIYRKVDWGLQASRPSDPDNLDRYRDNWDLVMVVSPAHTLDFYHTVVPTLADSTISGGMYRSVFKIKAITWEPGTSYDSWPDSGYSVDNLAPRSPYSLALAGSSTLSWRASAEKDWDYYAVYVNPDSGSTPELSSLLGYTIDTTFVLPDSAAGKYVLVTASDFSGNESEPSENLAVTTDVAGGSIPASYYLAPNVPNPFNPMTTLRFGLPRPGRARVSVHDVAGREVVVLTDERRHAGQFYLNWDGRDASGREAGSGIYFARMTAGDFAASQKMVLVR